MTSLILLNVDYRVCTKRFTVKLMIIESADINFESRKSQLRFWATQPTPTLERLWQV